MTSAKPTRSAASGRTRTRMLCEGAIMVALAQILSYIKIMELPNGGSLTPAMFPILLFAVRWGLKDGLLAGFVFGLLQLIFDGAYAWGWQSILGDYIVAYTLLGLAGLFHKNPYGYFYGVLVGGLARFLSHYITGATLWAEYMPDTFFGMTMTSPWFYSALYNGSYMLVDMIVCVVVGWALWKPLGKYIRGEDLQK